MTRLAVAVGVALTTLTALRAENPVVLRERFVPGYQYHVSTRVELGGSLEVPSEGKNGPVKTLKVIGRSAIEYDERVLDVSADRQVQKTVRLYRRIDFQRSVGGRPQENTIRPAVRRLVVLRHHSVEVPFSPDGPLTWNEIDQVRTDVFTPALAGLFPDRPVSPGDRWPAAAVAVQELTDLERIEEGGVECRLDQVAPIDGRRHARVIFGGSVRGVNEDGPNRQQLDGYFFFDLESNHLSYLYLNGATIPLDKDGRPQGKIEGRFVLTRQAPRTSPDLSDQALRGVELEPSVQNSLLLYENPGLGIRFLYPRRWRVAGVRGRQLGVDEANGSGLLITLDPPDRVPSAAQYMAEARAFLEGQKARILRADPPRRAAAPGIEQFTLEIEVAGQRVVMDYYVIRQARGGATVAARLLPADLSALRNEAERTARSLEITRIITADPPR